MSDRFKRWLSYIWPRPIYKGTSITVDDFNKSMQIAFKDTFNRRVSRLTTKFQMQSEYALYELVNITMDPKTNDIKYNLEHCATGEKFTVTDHVFKILFKTI